MAGGFGAVVIIFLIINHATETAPETTNRELLAESRLLEYQLTTSEENLSFLRDLVGNLSIRLAEVRETLDETIEELEVKEEDLERVEKTSVDQAETLERLIREIEEAEREVQTLSRATQDDAGQTTVEIVGEGDRQYLTGLYMGGQHILIALDVSASMLDHSIVNVLRLRNMNEVHQKNAPKWQRAIRTVEWLTANIPLESKFQIVAFNNKSSFLTNAGTWIEASDGSSVRASLDVLGGMIPSEGTNLKGLFELVVRMQPLPDNLFLIVDGLPTMDAATTNRTRVTGRQRLSLFSNSIRVLPAGIPVNVIMFPLEGDPFAPASYWNLAHVTGGILMSPSDDWP